MSSFRMLWFGSVFLPFSADGRVVAQPLRDKPERRRFGATNMTRKPKPRTVNLLRLRSSFPCRSTCYTAY